MPIFLKLGDVLIPVARSHESYLEFVTHRHSNEQDRRGDIENRHQHTGSYFPD
jgi:hypothetical protein